MQIKQIKPEVSTATKIDSSSASSMSSGKTNVSSTNSPDATSVAPDEPVKKGKFRMPSFKCSGKKRKILLGLGIFALVLLIFAVVSGILGYRVYRNGMNTKASVEALVAAGQAQDLQKIKEELANTQESVEKLSSSYKTIEWMGFLPYFGEFIKDGRHGINAAVHGLVAADVAVATMEPYADIIGFGSDGEDNADSGFENAQDRLDFVVKTLPDIVPKADELSSEMKIVQEELSHIDPERYPEEFAGIKVRQQLKQGLSFVDMGAMLVSDGKPLLEAAPYLLGTEDERKYLILFQNDKELRPTGGFLTAYSQATVDNARFKPVYSDDIYNLDGKYTPVTPAPDPIINYIKGPYIISKNLRLRDLNWSPDFRESMELFTQEAEKVGIDDIDGVIAVDTQLLVNILDVIGPIGVPGFGNFSTEIDERCNCPQVIYELESFADNEGPIIWDPLTGEILQAPPNIDNRKKIIGPLMNSVLSNALGQSKEKIPGLFEAVFKSLMEKHVLLYMADEEVQSAIESFGIAGRIEDYDGDYLHVNDANLGGRKSNLYVTHEVAQDIEIAKDGTVTKTVVITYNNPEKQDGWLNSVLPNWVRVYVPEGSELIDFSGVEDKEEPYEEFGKTVYSGFVELRPKGIAKVTLQYKLPFKVTDDEYKLYIQKQPGKDAPLHSITVNGKQEDLFLRSDKEFVYSI